MNPDAGTTMKTSTTFIHHDDSSQFGQAVPPSPKSSKESIISANNAEHTSDTYNDDEECRDEQLVRYQRLSKIGEGTYGQVFKARQRLTNRIVAIKKMSLDRGDGVPVTVMRELAILKELGHRNVIRIQDLIYSGPFIYLVTDLFDMDLRDYMGKYRRAGVTSDHIKTFLHQILSGLFYCHSKRIVHRDLKPENLLLESTTGRLVIADFGLSRPFGVPMRTYTHNVITQWYRPPEILLGSRVYSTAVDVWSVGCVFAEMMTLSPIFPGDSEIDQLFRIFRVLGTPTDSSWPEVSSLPDFHASFPVWKRRDLKEAFKSKYRYFIELEESALTLLRGMLECDPYNRLSVKKALESPYFYDDMSRLQFE